MDNFRNGGMRNVPGTYFERLYKEYYLRAVFFAQQYLHDREEAEDVAQDVFMTLWERKERIREDGSVQAFILTMVKNRCLNVLRRRMAEQKYSDYLSAREMMADYSALADDGFSRLNMEEMERLMKEGLEEVGERTREIFRMSRDRQMTYGEIARDTGISEKAVEYHMTKALAVLREKLKDYLPFVLFLFGGLG